MHEHQFDEPCHNEFKSFKRTVSWRQPNRLRHVRREQLLICSDFASKTVEKPHNTTNFVAQNCKHRQGSSMPKKNAAVHRDRLKNSKWHLYTLQEDRKQNVMQTRHREATSDRELCREVSRLGRTVWLCHQVLWPGWRNHAGACFCLANRWLKCGQICTKPSPKISHARHVLSQT